MYYITSLILPLIALWLVLRPFLSSSDKVKITILLLFGVTISAWMHFDVTFKTNKRTYPEHIRHFIYLCIQITITSLWSLICSRWTIHSLYLQPTRHKLMRNYVTWVLAMSVIVSWACADYKSLCFCNMWKLLLIIAGAWHISGNYIMQRAISVTVSILIPAAYFSYLDVSVKRSDGKIGAEINLFSVNDAYWIYCLLLNIIIVFIASTFDRTKAIVDTFYPCKRLHSSEKTDFLTPSYLTVRRFLNGLVMREADLPSTVIEDIRNCVKILEKKSQSCKFGAYLFPNDVAQDLIIGYAFCRATDDMIDDGHTVDSKKVQLDIIRNFITNLFYQREEHKAHLHSWSHQHKSYDEQDNIVWISLKQSLTAEQLSAFKSLSRIAYYLPSEPFYDLIDGYQWDVEQKPFRNEADLIEYGRLVSSSCTMLFLYLLCNKDSRWTHNLGDGTKCLITNIQKIGVILQLINISRDIICDSEELGRCYIPLNYIKDDEYKILTEERNPLKIDNTILKQYATRILDLAQQINDNTHLPFELLPWECQRPALIVLQLDHNLSAKIKSSSIYERKIRLNFVETLAIILKYLYFTDIKCHASECHSCPKIAKVKCSIDHNKN